MSKLITEILMERDKVSREEAEEQIQYAKDELQEAFESGNLNDVEDILNYDLGLEPDYIFELI